jgi:hypothetical protein
LAIEPRDDDALESADVRDEPSTITVPRTSLQTLPIRWVTLTEMNTTVRPIRSTTASKMLGGMAGRTPFTALQDEVGHQPYIRRCHKFVY